DVLSGSGLRWINQPVQRVYSETKTVPASLRRAGPVVGEPSEIVYALHAPGRQHQALRDSLGQAGGINVVDDPVGETVGRVEILHDQGRKKSALGQVAPVQARRDVFAVAREARRDRLVGSEGVAVHGKGSSTVSARCRCLIRLRLRFRIVAISSASARSQRQDGGR